MLPSDVEGETHAKQTPDCNRAGFGDCCVDAVDRVVTIFITKNYQFNRVDGRQINALVCKVRKLKANDARSAYKDLRYFTKILKAVKVQEALDRMMVDV